MKNKQEKIQELLAQADICLNGGRPWDLTVHDNRFFDRVIRYGSTGLGEAYMDGWWDAEELDEFFCKILKAELDKKTGYSPGWILLYLRSLFTNLQKQTKAYHIGEHHYDIGNDLYRAMLDKRMVYTGAYWQYASTLDEAQENKLEMVCQKLGLQAGQTVLDIGCGWGSFAKYAAEKYAVKVVGVTVSREQVELGRELCEGLPVAIRLQDYRELDEQFDHVVSLGMIEHVGYKNYRKYFDVVTRCLSDNGTFLLQSIGSSYPVRSTDPWIQKYIFPNSMLPSISQLAHAFEGKLVVEDWQNIGVDYDKTLMAWFRNFNSSWSSLKENYSERFYRMWKYYLLMSAGGFRARKNQLWQVLFTKTGLPNGFLTPGYRDSKAAYLSRKE